MLLISYFLVGAVVARVTRAVTHLNSDANVFLVTLWPLVVAVAAVAAVAWCLDLAIEP